MKRIAIVQPNFMPWRGAFDMISRVDAFVFLDTVQYTRNDWRNRNRVLERDGSQRWMTVPVKGSTSMAISDVLIDYTQDWRNKHLRRLKMAYGKTPSFGLAFEMLENAYADQPQRLVELTIPLAIRIARFLGITTEFIIASDLQTDVIGKNERNIALAKEVGATAYLSGPLALDYLQPELWEDAGIALEIMEYPDYPPYPQIAEGFVPNVSILDLICMTGREAPRFIWPDAPGQVQTHATGQH